MPERSRVDTWTAGDGSDLLSYDAGKQMFNVKLGRIKPAILKEFIEAAIEAMQVHEQTKKETAK